MPYRISSLLIFLLALLSTALSPTISHSISPAATLEACNPLAVDDSDLPRHLPRQAILMDDQGTAYAPILLSPEKLPQGKYSQEALLQEALPQKESEARPLILNFWAQWCAPCLQEIPSLIQYAQATNTRLVAIHVGGKGSVQKIAAQHGWHDLHTARIRMADARRAFDLTSIPLTLIYNPMGTLRARQDTPCAWQALKQEKD